MKLPGKFKIVRVRAGDPQQLDEMLRVHAPPTQRDDQKQADRYIVPAEIVNALVGVATNVWKARRRMTDPVSGEVAEEMKRVHADVERIQRCLNELGIAIEDHTNQAFDYGLPWKVVATKPTAGIEKEIVTETLRPTIRWRDQIIQHAEVEIATPLRQQEKP